MISFLSCAGGEAAMLRRKGEKMKRTSGNGPLVYEVDRSGVVRVLRGRERRRVLAVMFGIREASPAPPPAREGEPEPPPRKGEE
jgi:hypothetical protein